MADRDIPMTIYLTPEEKAEISEYAENADKTLAELGRAAIREYLDNDRAARIEDKLDRLLEEGGVVFDESQHTRTRAMQSQSVPEKARAIADSLYQNHDMPCRDADVEIAIENMAGADERTIEKYKRQLKKRGLLYKHPKNAVWTDEKKEFVKWIEGNGAKNGHIMEHLEPYKIDLEEYDEIAEDLNGASKQEATTE